MSLRAIGASYQKESNAEWIAFSGTVGVFLCPRHNQGRRLAPPQETQSYTSRGDRNALKRRLYAWYTYFYKASEPLQTQ